MKYKQGYRATGLQSYRKYLVFRIFLYIRKATELQSYGTNFFSRRQTKTQSYKETKKRSYKATEREFYPYSLTLLVLSWYPHQPESHQLSLNKWLPHGVTDEHLDPKNGPQVYLGPIKIPTFLNLEHFRPIFPMFDLQCTIFLIQKKSFRHVFPAHFALTSWNENISLESQQPLW